VATGKSGNVDEVAEAPTPINGTNPFAFVFAERELDLDGHKFSFRELSVKENDVCIDAARQPDGLINGRINMRMMIAKSSVEPKITVDDLAALPNRIYLKLAEFVNDINSIDDALADAEGEEDEGKS
jgi:hypothetical protein